MSQDWVHDIANMHDHYGMTDKFDLLALDSEKLKTLLRFRLDFLAEEMKEMNEAFAAGNPEEIVDALIDLCVVAIGTLDAFNVDAGEAWDKVLEANMSKTPGIKESRPNPLGLPDLIKPEGWTAPDHLGNHGNLRFIWQNTGACDL